MRISIAIPTHDNVPFLFAYDLASLVMHTTAILPDDVELGINAIGGTYVHMARQELAEAMLAQDVDFVLWLDSDMRFPRDAFTRLLAHMRDPHVGLVGVNYSTRGLPPNYVAIKNVAPDDAPTAHGAAKLVTDESSTGLEEVAALGFGCVLMRTDILRTLHDPKTKPWFWFDWLPARSTQRGEDVTFCKHVREAGHKILVDHDLSKECSHVGQFAFKLAHVEAWKGVTE